MRVCLLVCMHCVCTCACVHVYMYICKCFGGQERAWEPLGTGVTVGQELLNVGVRD